MPEKGKEVRFGEELIASIDLLEFEGIVLSLKALDTSA